LVKARVKGTMLWS